MDADSLVFAADPGGSGALAIVRRRDCHVLLVCNLTFRDKLELDAPALRATIKAALQDVPPGPCTYVIERPVAAPMKPGFGMTAYSAMMLGACYGALQAVLSEFATPAKWQPSSRGWKRQMGLSSSKRESVVRAKQLFVGLPNVLRHDRAEALLLAAHLMGLGLRPTPAKLPAKPRAAPRTRTSR
jgi:hypothetical protein